MKHIFMVHSHITYLAALGVIIKEELRDEDVFIISEVYNLPSAPVKIHSVSFKNSLSSLLLNPRYIFNPYSKLDELIEYLIANEDFVAYVPAFTHTNKILVTNKKCVSFHFIEEGLSAYYDYYDISNFVSSVPCPFRYDRGNKGIKQRLNAVRRVLRNSPKLDSLPLFYNSYSSNSQVKCYGFSPYSHPYAITRKEFSFNEIAVYYRFQSHYDLSNSYIWIGDPRDSNLTISEYIESIKESFIKYLLNVGVCFIYIKFHPREDEESKQALMNLLNKHKISYEIIPADVILEIELLNSKNVTLFGVYSSLLFYAALMGQKSFSIIDYFSSLKRNVSISKYWKYVEKI